jgi:hypothetical protein
MDISYPTDTLQIFSYDHQMENMAYLSKSLVLKLKAAGPDLTKPWGV